jgi:chromosome segregation ATPase
MQAHLDSLQDQIEYSRGELEICNDDLRRKDTIIAQTSQTLTAMAQRIPGLEASAEALESAVTAPEDEGNAATPGT